jgi:hypothetical protein
MSPARPQRRGTAHRTTAAAALAALLAPLAVVPAGADWLVTREGARIETSGPWKAQGKLVVFTRADGTLASLRADQLDLAASTQATEAAQELADKPPAAPAPPARRKSVVVLTDKDFKSVTPPAGSEAAPGDAPADGNGGNGEEGRAPAAAPTAPADGKAAAPVGKLEVVTWERVEKPGTPGVLINGTLRNNSKDYLLGIQVSAAFFDEGGTLLVQQPGTPAVAQLKPGETTTFTVRVDGSFGFAGVQFETKGTAFQVRQKPPEGGAPPGT